MPAGQFDEAFAMLERSFNDASFLKAYKSLPHGDNNPGAKRPEMPRLWTSTTIADDDDDDDGAEDTVSEGSMHEGYGDNITPPLSLARRASALPPTPPSQLRDHQSDTMESQIVPLPPHKSGVSTPVLQRSPPTPDLTPPNTRSRTLHPPRPSPTQYPSSAAESFVTAKEALSQSSAQNSQLSLPFETPVEPTWIKTARQMYFGAFDDDDDDSLVDEEEGTVTPTKGTFAARPSPSCAGDLERNVENRSDDDTPNNVLDDETLRNVTMRKKRSRMPHARSPRQLEQLGRTHGQYKFSANQVESSPPPRRKKSSHSLKPQVASNEGGDGAWPAAVNDMLYKHMRDEKSKRLSGVSISSTVVEAMVVLNPPPKSRTLRHAGRNLALRETGSSARTSSDSIETSHHRLRHRKSPLPHRTEMSSDDFGSKAAPRAVSNPEGQMPHRGQIAVSVYTRQRSLRFHARTKPFYTDIQQHRLHHTKPNTALLQAEQSFGSARPSLSEQLNATGPELSLSRFDTLPDIKPSRLRHVSAPLHMARGTRESAQPEEVNTYSTATGALRVHGLGPKQGGRSNELGTDTTSPETELCGTLAEHNDLPENDFVALSHDHTLTLKPHSGLNPGTYDYSMQSSPRRSEHANARHLHSAATPASLAVSTFSDRTDLMEVNEATAVNLYPHQNKSLILVQHVSRSSDASRTIGNKSNPDDISTPTESEESPNDTRSLRPIFTAVVDEPSTPITQSGNPLEVESPLRNPRAAPQPPIIQFIPPTPSMEDDRQLALRSPTPAGKLPERRPSLVQRARRYSESIIQPFLSRNNSMSRRYSSRDRPQSSSDRDTTLHPFWRPRGFWDEFDSESEDDGYDEPLPAGGDTSDIGHDNDKPKSHWSPRKMSVRMPGFRGTGGFHIGNSLGIDRHGTNVRRPYIALPSFSRNNTNDVGRASASSAPGPILRKRKSEEMLRTLSAYASTDSLRRRTGHGGVAKRYRAHRIPGLGLQVQILGIRGVKGKMREVREKREEQARERRRAEIRGMIGEKVFHEGSI
ncbi:hypothetical protein MBLNU459_g7175t1 [Dothideomycetes sp. NU459]